MAKIVEFKEDVLSQHDVMVFATMRNASTFITLMHSAGLFNATGARAKEMHGKNIEFLGDCTPETMPM